MRRVLSFVSVVALALPIATQQTIIVSGGGNTLQTAINQANPGDVLIVQTNQYTPILVTKGIAILCDPDVVISVGANTAPGITVRNLPAGERFRMRGGFIAAHGFNPRSATLLDNQGSVLFDETRFSSLITVLVDVTRSRQVAFNRCLLGRTAAVDSSVAFSGCVAQGACVVGFADPPNCSAISAIRSRVTISGGETRGANSPFFFPPSPAVQLRESTVTIAGDGLTLVTSGTGTQPTPAIESFVSGSLLINSEVRITGTTPNPIVGPATLRIQPTPSAAAQGTRSGQVFTVRTFGQPGSAVVLLADAPRAPVVTPFGDLWLGVNSLIVDAGTMPAIGERSRSFTLPPLARGEPTILQPIGLLTSGELVVGLPTAIVQN